VLLVEQKLKKKAVLCPEPLYNILTKSAALRPLDEVMKCHVNATNEKVPYDTLTPAEKSTLEAVFALVHTIIDPSQLRLDDVEIFQSSFGSGSKAEDLYRLRDEKMQLSRSILDVGHVHEFANRCTTVASGVNNSKRNGKCRCVETFLMTVIISMRAAAKSSNFQMRQGFEKLMTERLMEKLVGMALESSKTG